MADQEFQNNIKRRLADYEEEPDEDLWGGIYSSLPKQQVVPLWKKWALPGAAALLILSLSLLYFQGDNTRPDERTVADNSSSVGQREPHAERSESLAKPGSPVMGDVQNEKEKHEPRTAGGAESHPNDDNISAGNDALLAMDEAVRFSDQKTVDREGVQYQSGIGYHASYRLPELRELKKLPVMTAYVEEDQEEADESGQEKDPDSKWKAYLYGMPTFGYSRIEANRKDDLNVIAVEKISAFSKDRLGVRLEAGITRKINDRFSLLAGLVYFQRDQEITYTVATVKDVSGLIVDENSAFLVPEYEEEERVYENNLRNAGLQVGVLYTVPSEKFVQTLGTGIEFHKALNQNNEAFSELEQPSLYVFYNLFYRLEYPRQTKLKGLFQPTFNYSLDLNDELNTPFYVKPYGFGLNFGITYRL